MAPHHDCFIHAQLVASSPAGLIVEAFTDPERDPLQAELFEDAPEIHQGAVVFGRFHRFPSCSLLFLAVLRPFKASKDHFQLAFASFRPCHTVV